MQVPLHTHVPLACRLLLLRPGGRTIFSGALGARQRWCPDLTPASPR